MLGAQAVVFGSHFGAQAVNSVEHFGAQAVNSGEHFGAQAVNSGEHFGAQAVNSGSHFGAHFGVLELHQGGQRGKRQHDGTDDCDGLTPLTHRLARPAHP